MKMKMKTSKILTRAADIIFSDQATDPLRAIKLACASLERRDAVLSFSDSYFPYMSYEVYMLTRLESWTYVTSDREYNARKHAFKKDMLVRHMLYLSALNAAVGE